MIFSCRQNLSGRNYKPFPLPFFSPTHSPKKKKHDSELQGDKINASRSPSFLEEISHLPPLQASPWIHIGDEGNYLSVHCLSKFFRKVLHHLLTPIFSIKHNTKHNTKNVMFMGVDC